MTSEAFSYGVEIGSVSVKWAVIKPSGDYMGEVIPHGGNPFQVMKNIFRRHDLTNGSQAVVTGETGKSLLTLPYITETECMERALEFHRILPDTLISLGGETFSVYPLKNGRIQNIISTSKCAAGTGEFIVQQFKRMGYTLPEGIQEGKKGREVPIATRCSVHCKSDATHKLNRGECLPGDIARSLVFDLAKKVSKMVDMADTPARKMVIIGGVTQNELFLSQFKSLRSGAELILLPESPYFEAFGASLFAKERSTKSSLWLSNILKHPEVSDYGFLPPLKNGDAFLDFRPRTSKNTHVIQDTPYILGVDAGSTTTKAVLLNTSDHTIAASCYLRTLGNPILAVKNCVNRLITQISGKKIDIVQVGVTGSAREIVSVFLDNAVSVNEILAHARGATETLPDVDTVFEIGGQDSKYISFQNGIPVDYAMNEGCSAGTGSFLEESASVDMGISVLEISDIAEKSPHPIAFGERCAAFINTDVRNALQQGGNLEDVVAGLVCSIADNYISRVVGPRHIGENLLFLGGVALNRSVALAMANLTQQKIMVPEHPELTGCIGAALMVLDRIENGLVEYKRISLELISIGNINVKKRFKCNTCENMCHIDLFDVRGKTYPFGGICSKYSLNKNTNQEIKEGHDLIALRNRTMFDDFRPDLVRPPKGTIGLPLCLTTFELFPFYAKLIQELGFELILSEPTNAGNIMTKTPMCYPCELVHGAVNDLINKKTGYTFLPRVIDISTPQFSSFGYTCPSTSTIPDIIRAAFGEQVKLLSPHISMSPDMRKTTVSEITKAFRPLGLPKEELHVACDLAFSYFDDFKTTLRLRLEDALSEIGHEPTVIIAGRPYVVCPSGINLSLPRKIISRGYNVVSSDMLPAIDGAVHERDVWHFASQIENAVAYVQKYPNVYICLVSCFSCGPDASIYHYVRQALSGRVFCYLEIDSHTAHAGFDTRVGAFLDIIEEQQKITGDVYA